MNRLVPVLAVALGIAIGLSFPVLAARDASGTFTVLNNGTTVRNPVTAGQVITKDLWNGTFADVGTEMTDSLSRSGKGAMLQPLKLVSGVAATPGLTFSDSTTSGLYYGASTVGLSVSTTPSQTWTAAGTAIPGTVTVTGAANLNGATSLNGGIGTDITKNSGNLTITAPLGVNLDSSTAGQALRLQTDGTTRLSVFDTYIAANSVPIRSVTPPSATAAAAGDVMTVDASYKYAGSWTSLTVGGTGCSAGAIPPSYQRRGGVVYLRGTMATGSTAPCTLSDMPAGYRPAGATSFPLRLLYTSGTPGPVNNGIVTLSTAGVWGGFLYSGTQTITIYFDGLSFLAEN